MPTKEELATMMEDVQSENEALKKELEALKEEKEKREAAEKAATGERYASRVVDIDIIFYDDIVVDRCDLKLPHPLMHEREFVLRPMLEVAPAWRHPILGKTVEEMIEGIQNYER